MAFRQSNQWHIRSKLWLEIEGHPVIGEGRLAMLEAIDRHRSMIEASRETGISYRRMRGAIRDMEQVIGCALVTTYRGGSAGGRSELTPAALALLKSFKALAAGFRNEADVRFHKYFDTFARRLANSASRRAKEIHHDSSR
jgi:molybdate transport system regulatory protein